MLMLAVTPTVDVTPLSGRRDRLKEIAEEVTQTGDLDQHTEEILTIVVGGTEVAPDVRARVLGAFEDFRSAWEENDDFQEGRLCVSQIDPDLTGPDAGVAAAEKCEQNMEEELSHVLKVIPVQAEAGGA
jgi:hypothetical protein